MGFSCYILGPLQGGLHVCASLADSVGVDLSSAFLPRQRAPETCLSTTSWFCLGDVAFQGRGQWHCVRSLGGTEQLPFFMALQVLMVRERRWVGQGAVIWGSWGVLGIPAAREGRGKRGPERGDDFDSGEQSSCSCPPTRAPSGAASQRCLCRLADGAGVLPQTGFELDLSSQSLLIWLGHLGRM